MSEQTNNDEVKDTPSDMELKRKKEFQAKKEAKDKSIEIVKDVAQTISDEARKQNGQETKKVNWDEWNVTSVEPAQPLRLGDLKESYPDLVNMLQTPSGEVEIRRDRIDDDTKISSLGVWRNPDSNYSALRLSLDNEDDSKRTIRRVNLVAGFRLERVWDNIGCVRDTSGYMEKEPAERQKFLAAMEQVNQLARDTIGEPNHNAVYKSFTESIGKEAWEK